MSGGVQVSECVSVCVCVCVCVFVCVRVVLTAHTRTSSMKHVGKMSMRPDRQRDIHLWNTEPRACGQAHAHRGAVHKFQVWETACVTVTCMQSCWPHPHQPNMAFDHPTKHEAMTTHPSTTPHRVGTVNHRGRRLRDDQDDEHSCRWHVACSVEPVLTIIHSAQAQPQALSTADTQLSRKHSAQQTLSSAASTQHSRLSRKLSAQQLVNAQQRIMLFPARLQAHAQYTLSHIRSQSACGGGGHVPVVVQGERHCG
jgi:hypothetical protein